MIGPSAAAAADNVFRSAVKLVAEPCDLDGCFARCTAKYNGSMTGNSTGDTYFCAKGCAGMSGGAVVNAMSFCNEPEQSRYSFCLSKQTTSGCSEHKEEVNMCKFGCQFWKKTALTAVRRLEEPGQSMIGHSAATAADNVFRHAIKLIAEHTVVTANAKSAPTPAQAQPPQPGQSMVGPSAAAAADSVIRKVIGLVAEHNSSVPKVRRNASSGAEHTVHEKKNTFRAHTPEAVSEVHVYKAAEHARSRSRAATGSDQSVCLTDRVAAAINSTGRAAVTAQNVATSAEVSLATLRHSPTLTIMLTNVLTVLTVLTGHLPVYLNLQTWLIILL
jgi:hypothetical protein